MLQLLSNCPAETAHLRKELLIAAKHILTTELRNRTCARPLPARLHVGWAVGPLSVLAPLTSALLIAALTVFSLLCLPSSPLPLIPLSLKASLFHLPPGFLLYPFNNFIINVTVSLAQFAV